MSRNKSAWIIFPVFVFQRSFDLFFHVLIDDFIDSYCTILAVIILVKRSCCGVVQAGQNLHTFGIKVAFWERSRCLNINKPCLFANILLYCFPLSTSLCMKAMLATGDEHFVVYLTTALRTTRTAFESHEKSEQDNFFTLTSIWHFVKICRWQVTNYFALTASDPIYGKNPSDTCRCSCLVPSVLCECESTNNLYLQDTICSLLCVHQPCLKCHWLHSESCSLYSKQVQCTMQHSSKKRHFSFTRCDAFSEFYCRPSFSCISERHTP